MPLPGKSIVRYLAAAALVGASTGAAELLYRLTGSTRLSMVFLAAVLVTAYALGSGPAYFAAALAFLIYNFYLVDPRFSIEFSSPEELITLAVFLAVAMLTGNLTGRVRDEAKRAEARARMTAILFEASREFSASSDEGQIRARLAHHLAAAAKGQAVVADGQQVTAAPTELDPSEDLSEVLDQAMRQADTATTRRPGDWRIRPLRSDQAGFGAAAWRPSADERLDDEGETLLEILADAGAAAIARAKLAAAKSEAEARARTEDLRNALLSSISHDLRTPLAAIMASASSLRDFDAKFDDGTRRDLAATIQEEAERLDLFVANLLNMTRIEAGALPIQHTAFNVPEVIRRTVDRRTRASHRHALVSVSPDLPEALGDPVLFEQALGNVVENALRYTPREAPLTVTSSLQAGEVVVEVADAGPGVPPHDLPRIFEKFYRSPAGAQKPGTGLGLSIVRGLMEGMHGSVTAENREGAGGGLLVTLRLPAAA